MISQSHCPTSDILRRLLLGQVTDAEASGLESHLSGCPACLQTIQSLELRDTLLDAMRAQARVVDEPDSKIVASLIENARALQSAETSTGEAAEASTLAPDALPAEVQETVDRDQYSFLAPPQARDELGRLGPYRVLKVVGVGGMGVVFQAEDPHLKRLVALKAMRPELAASESAKKRFLREAQATAAIENDRIVTIHQVGEDRGVPYIAMQFLQGETLEDWLRRHPRPPLRDTLRIARHIAEGLAAAHDRGLMHRDIKPANIWLEARGGRTQVGHSTEGARGDRAKGAGGSVRVKIVDFGLARPASGDSAGLTQFGAIVGTPAYIAPEQAKNEQVDPRCDLFSLGCVMYRMTTGEMPFKGSSTIETLLAVMQHHPPAPHELSPQVPEEVGRLVMRLLEKDPARRPPEARKVIQAIAAIEQKLAEKDQRTASEQNLGAAAEPPQGGEPAPAAGPNDALPSAPPGRPAALELVTARSESLATETRRTMAAAVSRRFHARRLLIAVAAVAILAIGGLFAPQIVRIVTNQGVVELHVEDPSIEMKIKNGAIQIVDSSGKQNFTLSIKPGRQNVRAGEYRLVVANDAGLVVDARELKLTRGGRVRLWATARSGPATASTEESPAADTAAVATADASPAASPSGPAAADWLDLLAPIEAERVSAGSMKWRRHGSQLVGTREMPPGKRDWVVLKMGQNLTRDLDFEADLLVVDCVPVFVDVPVGETIVSIVLDPRPGGSGLNNVDNKLQPSPLHSFQHRIRQTLKVSVRHRAEQVDVAATLNGAPLGSYSGPRSRLTFPPAWADPAPGRVKVAAFVADSSSRVEIHRAVVRTSTSVLLAAEPAREPARSSGAPTAAQPEPVPGKSAPNASRAPADFTLVFDGIDDYVAIPAMPYNRTAPVTFEAWVTPAIGEKDVTQKTYRGVWANAGWLLQVSPWGWSHWRNNVFGLQGPIAVNRRVHLVAQWDGKAASLFIDGKQLPVQGKDDGRGSDIPRHIGCVGDIYGNSHSGFFPGQIDEIRISSISRYAKSFTPPQRNESDGDTWALYHCDEGQGDVLRDSSGHGRDGRVVGASWVNANAPGGVKVTGVPPSKPSALPAPNPTAPAQKPPRHPPPRDPPASTAREQAWRASPPRSMEQSLAAVQKRREEIDAEHYRPGSIRSIDEVELRDGRRFVGKLIEYGTHVIIVTNRGRQIFPRQDIARAEAKKRPDEMKRPDLPDLDVTHIERTPRMRSNHGNVNYVDDVPTLKEPNPEPLFPIEGTEVTFTAHVLNKGLRESGAAKYQWLLDGKPAGEGNLSGLSPRAEATATLRWRWQDGPHTVTFAVQPPAGVREVSTRNNRLTDRTDALGLLIHVTKESYDEYNRVPNMIDTFSFEDWVQFHFEVWNFLFEEGVYPDAPAGCLARTRVDKFLYVNEGRLEQEVYAAQCDGHPSGYYFEGTWQFGTASEYARWMAHMDWGFIHEMGHQLGLIDEYRLFASEDQIRVKHGGEFVNLTHGYSQADTMMSHHGPFPFSDQATLALNRQLLRHRGYFGDYQFAMPDRSVLRIVNREGEPVTGARLAFYQRRRGQGFVNEPVGSGTTDARGELVMPNQPAPDYATPDGLFRMQPNPFGKLDVLGDAGLLLVKLQFGEFTEWHWLENTPFNVSALAGRKVHQVEIKTHLPPASMPDAPRNARAAFVTAQEVDLTFEPVRGAKSYRVYGKNDREGWSDSRFKLLQTTTRTKLSGLNVRDKAMYLAVTAVDAAGKESGLSNLAYCQCLDGVMRIVVSPDGTRYISDAHPHVGRIIRQRPDRTIDDWEIRPAPDTRGRIFGLAITKSGQLLATNNYTHRVHLFALSGEELKIFGGQGADNGQFNEPKGVCVDANGDVYVADTGNHRIQVFDADLNWRSNLSVQFREPQGMAWSGERLFVADTGNRRIAVLEESGGTWRIVRTIDGLQSPVDVAIHRAGQAIVADPGSGSVLVFDAAGKPLQKFGDLGEVQGVAVTADGTILAASGFNRVHELRLEIP